MEPLINPMILSAQLLNILLNIRQGFIRSLNLS
jgi:hypothetical protein